MDPESDDPASEAHDDAVEQRLADVEIELAYVVAVLHAHAELLRSIGVLTAVFAVDPEEPGEH